MDVLGYDANHLPIFFKTRHSGIIGKAEVTVVTGIDYDPSRKADYEMFFKLIVGAQEIK